MTGEPLGHHSHGQAARERPLIEHNGVGPWNATVKVVPVRTARGRHSSLGPGDVMFEVYASWTGPPPIGAPPSPGRPVEASDLYLTAELEQARAIAQRAVDALRTPRVPDLRGLDQQVAGGGT